MNHFPSAVSRLALLFVTIAAVTLSPRVAHGVTDEEVGKAIERLKKILLQQQAEDGSIGETPGGDHLGGRSALATLALLESGESLQRPEVAKAIAYLQSIELGTPPPAGGVVNAGSAEVGNAKFDKDTKLKPTTNSTYAISLLSHVWAALPPTYLPNLEKSGGFLLNQSHNGGGGFHYTPTKNPDDYDNSTTQYGVLGVWEAAKAGGKVSPEFWMKVAEHFIKCQNEDGGWQYSGNTNDSTPPMTVAGVTGMFIVQQQLFATASKPNPKVEASLSKGLDWLDKNYAPSGNMYYMYGVERVGLASGYKFFNNKDWYQSGAQLLVTYNGGTVQDTSFALLFLARGRVPVWISKLKIPEHPWNNRPNDLYRITRFISDQREAEQNWQIVSIDVDPELWMGVPLVYVASDKALKLTDKQKSNLKRYLDLGGTMLATADNGSAEFKKSIRELAKEMYPAFAPKKITLQHPIYRVLHQFTTPGEEIETVSNGARDLIIMPTRDWAMEFQKAGDDARATSQVVRLAMNLFAIVTDRGTLNNRLAQGIEARKKDVQTEVVDVGRAKYDGNWLPEPEVWDAVSHWATNRVGVEVATQDVDLDKLGECELPLVHLQGVDPRPLTQGEIDGIRKYCENGGTLLVETVGGRGTFARDIENQFTKEFKRSSAALKGEPIVTGEKLTGGFNAKRVVYTREAVLRGMTGLPRLTTFMINSRPAIIFSPEDLSLGAIGVKQPSIVGYTSESSRQLMTNLLLAVKAKASEPKPVAAAPAETTAAPAK